MQIGNLKISNNVFLAPMAGITDLPFRLVCREKGCGVSYTEMVSAKGLYYGSEKTEAMLNIHPGEHPIGIQLFGSDPEIMARMAEVVSEYNVDIIDINMGCPAPKIVRNGEGCALMKEPHLVKRIVSSVVGASKKPVTVKIRKGWDDDNINAIQIARIAEDEGASAVTVHGRTREQFYSGKADWKIISDVKAELKIPVIGNGDIFSPEQAGDMIKETGCDGIMVARGAQGNPWLFERINRYLSTGEISNGPSANEKIDMAIRHLDMSVDYMGEFLAVPRMRKHIAWYLKGLKGGTRIKNRINSITEAKLVKDILLEYRNKF